MDFDSSLCNNYEYGGLVVYTYQEGVKMVDLGDQAYRDLPRGVACFSINW